MTHLTQQLIDAPRGETLRALVNKLSISESALLITVDESEDGVIDAESLRRTHGAGAVRIANTLARRGLLFRTTARDGQTRVVRFERNALAVRVMLGIADEDELV